MNLDLKVVFILASHLAIAYAACPNHFTTFNNKCYRYFSTTKKWLDADTYCNQYQYNYGRLVSISSLAEKNFVDGLTSSSDTWIGLNDRSNEDTFRWSDGTSFVSSSYKNWASGEPNNAGLLHFITGDEDCVVIKSSGEWNDKSCNDQKPFVCECST